MNAPLTITAKLRAWTAHNYQMRDLMDAMKKGNQQRAAEALYFSNSDMDKGSDPWTCVGEVDVTVRVCSQDVLVQNQLKALNAELEHARAEWLTKQQQILDQISKVQALDYVEAAA